MDEETFSLIRICILVTAGFLVGASSLNKEGILVIPLFVGFVLIIMGSVLQHKSLRLEENLSEQEIKDKVDLILLRAGKLNELGGKY